ncbi:Toxin HigB / Protein kinase domain of HipA [uncultured Gammaproteobacteria bacterium]|nr:Toxin HigB / Protein kinase domain of HipA [uncultured Gammaproteobacteria bacterium]
MNGSKLFVCIDRNIIANLELIDGEVIWRYSNYWQKNGYALSPYLPLSNNINNADVKRYLNNLLPEGSGLDELVTQFGISKNNTFALVRILGQDLPSLFSLSANGCAQVNKTQFIKLKSKELADRLNKSQNAISLIIWDGKPRLSVAGVQNKINVVINDKGEMGFGEGDLRSTHLLKFENGQSTNLVINEHITMGLARACRLDVADTEIKYFDSHPGLLVKRFDRKLAKNTTQRRHMIDGAQALNLPPEYKYERNFGSGRDVKHIRDGASLPKLFSFADKCISPALTKQKLLDWVLFNLMVCNADAHGKNVSFFLSSKGIELTPFYDLVNIAMYEEFDQELAMAIGDEFDMQDINAYQLADFADNCRLKRSLIVRNINNLADKLLENIDNVINNANINIEYAKKYKKLVVKRVNHFLSISSSIIEMEI